MVEPKPLLDPAATESEQALISYYIALEMWGEHDWVAVAWLCRWTEAMGARVSVAPPNVVSAEVVGR